jgi:hypothetical protein
MVIKESHKSAQASFLKLVGFIMDKEECEIDSTVYFTQEMCEDIAVALQHKSYQAHPAATHLLEHPSRDPTFTEEEFDSYQRAIREIIDPTGAPAAHSAARSSNQTERQV